MRYMLQWLVKPDAGKLQYVAQNNVDATFKKHSCKLKPSELLLHYNYGAAAVNWWGRGKEVLHNRLNIPCPIVSAPAPLGPMKMLHDRTITIKKRDTAQHADEAGTGIVMAGDEAMDMVESKDQAQWDEDDVMLFFWGNSQAAVECYHRKQEEMTWYMEQWRQGMPSLLG